MGKQSLKRLMEGITAFYIAIATSTVMAFAGTSTGIVSPFTPTSTDTVGGVITKIMAYVIGAVEAIAGAWFLFHLYKAVMLFMAGSRQAQKRDEAKSHIMHVIIAGVLLGGALVISSAVFNFGSSL